MKKSLLMLVSIMLLAMLLKTDTTYAIQNGQIELTKYNSINYEYGSKVIISPNGKYLAEIRDYSTIITKIDSGIKKEITDYRNVYDAAFSNDSKQIALSNEYGIFIIDTISGEEIAHYEMPVGESFMATKLAFAADDSSLYFAEYNKLGIFNLNDGTVTYVVDLPGRVDELLVNSENDHIALLMNESYTELNLQVRTGSGDISLSYSLPKDYVWGNPTMKYSYDGKYLSLSYDLEDKKETIFFDVLNNYKQKWKIADSGTISFIHGTNQVLLGNHLYDLNGNLEDYTLVLDKNNNTDFNHQNIALTSDNKYFIVFNTNGAFIYNANNLNVKLSSLSISPHSVHIGSNVSVPISVTGIYSDGSKNPIDVSKVKWLVGDFSIAKIENGKLTGLSSGETTLKATYGGLTSQIAVIVDTKLNKKVIELFVNEPLMAIGGEWKEIDEGVGTSPLIYMGRTLLPIRSLVEEFGGSMKWSQTEQKVTILYQDINIDLWINKQQAKVNGISKTLDVPPMLMNGRTMLPLRFVSDNLGLELQWEQSNQKITISSGN